MKLDLLIRMISTLSLSRRLALRRKRFEGNRCWYFFHVSQPFRICVFSRQYRRLEEVISSGDESKYESNVVGLSQKRVYAPASLSKKIRKKFSMAQRSLLGISWIFLRRDFSLLAIGNKKRQRAKQHEPSKKNHLTANTKPLRKTFYAGFSQYGQISYTSCTHRPQLRHAL